MDKNAIKKFAVWARRELIERVSQKAMQYGIEKDNIVDAAADSINGKILTDTQKNQRRALISQINAKGYEEVMEEVAYTWFNRLIALRFMEVNGYLPTRVRVFTDEENNFKPQIIDEALHLDLDGLNMDKVYEFKNANQTEELYKYLLITQCNALNSVLPGMFQRISDYTELLLPDNLLREGSVIEQMISLIQEEDWKDAVQIIGWLYQYYNAEKKDEVFAALKKNVKITKENIPAATQLFTPDWIVRYMVENSLGRLWVEGHPNDELKSGWKYYLEEAEQEPEVQAQLAEIRKEYATMKPEEIRCIDPCCGSGHILAYLFDVLVQIYESYGYTTREAVESIVKNNLYGLDIDDRAAQLAYFAVMMKARQYDRRFFSRQIQPNVYAIQESNNVDRYALEYFCNGDTKLKAAMDSIITEMHDAKEYGSILNITPVNFAALYARFDEIRDDISMSKESVLNSLLPLVQVAEALAQKYDVVVTNPPYMGSSGMSAKLTDFVKKNYPDSKSDLFAVFIESCGQMAKKNGYQAMITQHAWMFLSSFEKLRQKLLMQDTVNMAHLGARAFEEIGGEVVQTTSFVMRKSHLVNYKGTYCRLIEPTTQQGKEDMFLTGENRYTAQQSNFSKIPGSPVAYWVSESTINLFDEKKISESAKPIAGICTGDNNKYFRMWYEVNGLLIGKDLNSRNDVLNQYQFKWFFHYKGGEFRRWYGNIDYVINYTNQSISDMATNKGFRHDNREFYFKQGITWSKMCSGKFSARYMNTCSMFDSTGTSIFPSEELYYGILGLLNSKITLLLIQILNPTFAIYPNNIGNLPIVGLKTNRTTVEPIVKNCILSSKEDWDSFETSWDFKIHPLVRLKDSMKFTATDGDSESVAYFLHGAYRAWENECDNRFVQLKANEEELNRIFIDIYGLQDELTPEIEDKDVTVRKADLQRDVKSLISYAVGCMFGRYSPLKDGLLYAGGDWDYTAIQQELMYAIGKNEFSSGDMVWDANFIDKDNIIPICDDEYFDDDIVGRFVKFIEAVYGKDALEENLKFIADALGGKGQPREIIRNYFLNDFYADHCKIYQKRPIYWLFDSGKKNGFKALIYMHRYQPDTIARIRTDYVHEQQSRYRTAIADMENRIANASTSERVKLNKALTKLKDQDTELRSYEEKIHHLADQMIAIDLDDGVKVNYEKFQDVLGKIK
jgi:type II restriction/modification system DNA methylase subunit YeeA